MSNDIQPTATTALIIVDRLTEYAKQADGAFAANTARAIKADTAVFAAWCAEQGQSPLPAESASVADFIDCMATEKKPSTIRRYVASIAHLHRAAGLDDPTKSNPAKLALKRLGRQHGSRQQQAAPFGEMAVERVLATTGDSLIDRRDLALLMVSRDMLARRSEVVALRHEDVQFADDGSATVLVQRSKTDTAGEGAVLWLSPRTTAALKAWLDGAGIATGALFRSVGKGGAVGGALDAGDVSRRFKVMAERASIDASLISGHSARVGMAQDLVGGSDAGRQVEVSDHAGSLCRAAVGRAGCRGAVLRSAGVSEPAPNRI